MGWVRLRTKFLIAMLLTSAGLTAVTLVIVQRTVEHQVRRELANDLAHSVETFRNVQREREITLAHSAELIADLPSLKALMTSHHAPTIQDASGEMFRLSGGDVFALLDSSGHLVGFHTRSPGISREQAEQLYQNRGTLEEPLQWWFAGGHLYEVFLEPIYIGLRTNNSVLGEVAVGYEINDQVARQVSKVAASEVAILCQQALVVTTLNPTQAAEFSGGVQQETIPGLPTDLKLGNENFVVASLVLNPHESPPVTMFVMKSYDQAAEFLNRLRRLLLAVGLGAVFLGSVLVYITSRTFTRPLEKLVEGVRALGKGDFGYPLQAAPVGEVAALTVAFTRMRDSLQDAQHRLLASERLATIGRMASSISHDLRHPLTAVLANAEFLSDATLSAPQREELYLEIRVAVNRLTDLIDSLLELSRPAESLTVVDAQVERTASRAIELIRAHPEFQKVTVGIESSGLHRAQYDPRKMERVFYNLLLNACQAVQARGGHVAVTIEDIDDHLMIRISDNGPGVDNSVHDRLFQPFVSYGKENGTGMGLTIAQKIVQDHNGSLELESSVSGRTVMRIILPRLSTKTLVRVEASVGDMS
jgi:signal transduction histidine kinase